MFVIYTKYIILKKGLHLNTTGKENNTRSDWLINK